MFPVVNLLDAACLHFQVNLASIVYFAVYIQTFCLFISILWGDFIVAYLYINNGMLDHSRDQVYQHRFSLR